MPLNRATLQQVAQRAGVSRTTASFVLTGRYVDMRISEEARQRVLRAAKELDYRPNLMARGLRTKVTRTVALVSDTLASDPYAGHAIYGSLATAVARGHLLLVGETNGDPRIEERVIGDFIDRQVDAFVYASMFTRQVRLPRLLRGRPVVLLNCFSTATRPPLRAVIPDELTAGRSAAGVLLDAGHRSGIHIVGNPAQHVFAGRERTAGIRERLGAAQTGIAGTIDCDWWPEPAYEAVARALADGVRPHALICLNDRIAFGAYQALRETDLDIPGDVSVVSFDDSDLAAWLRPQLTSVSLPHYELGRHAVDLLLDSYPNGEAPDGDAPDGDALHGKSPDGDALHGKSPDGDALHGKSPDGKALHGKAHDDGGAPIAGPTPDCVIRVPMPVRHRASVAGPAAG